MFGRLRMVPVLASNTRNLLNNASCLLRGSTPLVGDVMWQRADANPAPSEQETIDVTQARSSALQPHRGFASGHVLHADATTSAREQSGHPYGSYPKKDPQEVDVAPLNAPEGAGFVFGGMAVIHAGHAFVHLLDPHKMATYTFAAVGAGPVGDLYDPLHRLMGAGHLAAATSFMALRFGAEGHELDQPWAKRVNLGLAAASVGMLGAHLSHWSLITPLAAMSGSLTMGVTLATSLYYYIKYSGHGLQPGPMFKEGFQADMGKLLTNARRPASAAYSALTLAYLGAGAAYLALPAETLSLVLHMPPSSAPTALADWAFLWRCTGAALLTLPTWTYSLKEANDRDILGKPQFKTLNFGLAAAGVAHFVALSPFLTNNEYGPLLPVIMGTWAAATAVGALRLFRPAVGSAVDAVKARTT